MKSISYRWMLQPTVGVSFEELNNIARNAATAALIEGIEMWLREITTDENDPDFWPFYYSQFNFV